MLRSSNQKNDHCPFEAGARKRWDLPGFRFYEDDENLRLSCEFLWFYINLLIRSGGGDAERSWGFYFMDRRNFVFRWGKGYYSFDLPFISLVFVKHEIMSLDRKRVVYLVQPGLKDFDLEETAKRENSADFSYRYELLNGKTQDVNATVVVERFTRRWKWTPLKQVQDSIWVSFSEEVGPERGSWKGGVTGCGWTMERGETVVQCLRRMERERRFER